MIGHCKDCSFWNREKEEDYLLPKNTQIHSCRKILPVWEHTTQSDPWYTLEWKETAEQELAFVRDGEEYEATLLTKATFGCVQFHQKDSSP